MQDIPIAVALERDRLEHRLRRMERVLSALRDRAVFRDAEIGTQPPALRHAIAGFEDELAAVRQRLDQLHGRQALGADPPPVKARRRWEARSAGFERADVIEQRADQV